MTKNRKSYCLQLQIYSILIVLTISAMVVMCNYGEEPPVEAQNPSSIK